MKLPSALLRAWLFTIFICTMLVHLKCIDCYRSKSMNLHQLQGFFIEAFFLVSLFVERPCLDMRRFVRILSIKIARNEIDTRIAKGLVVQGFRWKYAC